MSNVPSFWRDEERALADLAEQGYIERRQGVGSFVRQHGRSDELPSVGSYMDGLRQTQFQTSIEVVEHDQRTPPSSIGDALGVRSGQDLPSGL